MSEFRLGLRRVVFRLVKLGFIGAVLGSVLGSVFAFLLSAFEGTSIYLVNGRLPVSVIESTKTGLCFGALLGLSAGIVLAKFVEVIESQRSKL